MRLTYYMLTRQQKRLVVFTTGADFSRFIRLYFFVVVKMFKFDSMDLK